MKKPFTWGAFITTISIIGLPILGWAWSMEKVRDRSDNNQKEILLLKQEAKQTNKAIQKHQIEVMKGIYEIKVLLKDKQDRK